MSEQTEKPTEFPALSAYQKAILTAMEIPLFAARTDMETNSALPNKLIPHPTMTITSDLQLFLAELRPDIFVFLNDEVVLDERGIGLPAVVNATHKKQVWSLLKTHLADTSA